MGNILDRILATKREEVAALRASVSMARMRDLAAAADETRGFLAAMASRAERKQPAIIAEIKRASPSKGLIREAFDPAAIAKAYRANGAACLSVLTDRTYFQGGLDDLIAARASCDLPVLRKDFIVDEIQIYEARAAGADAILLIVSALTDEELSGFEDLAVRLGMDVLVETHDEAELDRALRLQTRLLGVNNRDLKTFSVDLSRCLALKSRAPADRVIVCESGVTGVEDMLTVMGGGVYGFLIGEALMRAPDPGQALHALASLGRDCYKTV